MNVIMWILAGGFVGWVAYSFLHFNWERGRNISIFIGAAGGFFGGKMIAPIFIAAATDPGELSAAALFVGIIAALAFLGVGTLVRNLWGV